MAVCGECFVGLCKRHPLQDHGRGMTAKGPKTMSKREVISHMYESTVAKQLEKLRGAAKSKMETAAATSIVTEADRVS